MNLNLELLIKILSVSTSDKDGEALSAIRAANAHIKKMGWDWEKLLRGKVTVAADPFLNTPHVDTKSFRPPPPPPPRPDAYIFRATTPPPRPQPRPTPQPTPQPRVNSYSKPFTGKKRKLTPEEIAKMTASQLL